MRDDLVAHLQNDLERPPLTKLSGRVTVAAAAVMPGAAVHTEHRLFAPWFYVHAVNRIPGSVCLVERLHAPSQLGGVGYTGHLYEPTSPVLTEAP